ncbi:MAG: hypothetical protein QXH57_02470 [Sulfolobales archaeon]
MSRRVVLFVGYNSRSYELIRRLKLNNVNMGNVDLIHIPDTDEMALPSIIIEEVIDGMLIREELQPLSNHYLELLDEYVHSTDYGTYIKSKQLSII